MLGADKKNQIKGDMFETEMAMMFDIAGIDYMHHSRDTSHPDNKYNVDFILRDDLIGVDAKFTGTPITKDAIRTKDGKVYPKQDVYRIYYDQLNTHKKQRKAYGLTETYFVHRIEFQGVLQYKVISLSDLDRIYMEGGSRRTINSEHKYYDRWDNGKLKFNKAIIIFPEDTMTLPQFFNMLKGGM